jgi:hypothetical protein
MEQVTTAHTAVPQLTGVFAPLLDFDFRRRTPKSPVPDGSSSTLDLRAKKGDACSSVSLPCDPLGLGADVLGVTDAVRRRDRGRAGVCPGRASAVV